MAISRNYQYDESKRPKLPRNVYDWIYTGDNESSSMFTSSGGYVSVTTPVGAPMPEISVFTGATDTTNGTSGLVPAPVVGDQLKFLQGTGAWIDIPAYRWLQEFPSNSSTKTGLQINGDFHVSNTLSAQTLRVEGAAHFWELVIDSAKANGGQIFVSPALFEVDYVGTGTQYAISHSAVQSILTERVDIAGIFDSNNVTHIHTTRAYMRCDDGDTRTANECVIGDMLRCKQFNIQPGVYENVDNKDYWTFVVNTSNGAVNYTLSDGTVQKCFWIDLADYLVVSGGGRVPFNSVLTYTGEITVDPGQNTDIDLTDLKRQAQRTYNGTTTVDTEYGTLTSEIRSSVLNMYGISGGTRNLVSGNSTATQSSFSAFDLNQIQSGLSQIANGTMDSSDDNLDATNLASLIVDETIADDAPSTNDLDAADSMTYRILGIDNEISIDLTPTQSAVITPSGANRAPAASPSVGDNYNWQTDPEYNQWQFGYGLLALEAGDHLASFGHLFDKSRMNAIVISAATPIDSTLDPPSIAQYSNIDRFGVELAKFRTTCLANNGNEFTGSFLVDHNGVLMDVNERINLFITDLNTGLETVGIHLDGENSTIKLVGSVEIRQHDTNSYDTLSVYDSSNNKKVEITPTTIPAITDLSNNLIIPANNGLQVTNYSYTYSGSDIQVTETTSGALWWKKYNYTYTLRNASHTFTVSCPLGDLYSGDKLTIGSGSFTLNCPIYFNGMSRISDRDGQSIDSFYMRIKRGTSAIWTVDLKNNFTMPSVDSDSITINIGTNMKSQTSITSAGSYSVEFSLTFTFKAEVYESNTSQWANPRMGLDAVFVGSFNSTIERSSSNANSFMQIGTNGLAFNMGNNKYMYASDSAMKFNWMGSSWSNVNAEGVGIEFSDTAGMKITRNVRTYSATPYSSSGTYAVSVSCNLYDDYVICNASGSNASNVGKVAITLPSASSYGKGRTLTIIVSSITNLFALGSDVSQKISYSGGTVVRKNYAIRTNEYDSSQEQYVIKSVYLFDGIIKLISDGSTWYEI